MVAVIGDTLSVYYTGWMPQKMRTIYERMEKDARALEIEAENLANIEIL